MILIKTILTKIEDSLEILYQQAMKIGIYQQLKMGINDKLLT